MNGMRLMRHTKNGKLYLVSTAAVVNGKIAAVNANGNRGWVYVKADQLRPESNQLVEAALAEVYGPLARAQ